MKITNILLVTVFVVLIAAVVEGKECVENRCNKHCMRIGQQKGECKDGKCSCNGMDDAGEQHPPTKSALTMLLHAASQRRG
nr:potassium channel toxin alpha-KTX 12 Sp2-like [Parasteatoda tepidariorum]